MKYYLTMRKFINLLLSSCVVFILVSSCSNNSDSNNEEDNPTTCECSDLQLDALYNHFYINDRTKGYTGRCIEKNNQGVVIMQKDIIKGKVNGEVKTFYDNGALKRVKTFKMNLQDGLFYELSPEGDTLIKALFVKGVQDTIYYKKF